MRTISDSRVAPCEPFGNSKKKRKNMQKHLSVMELPINVYLSLGNISRKIRSRMCDICIGDSIFELNSQECEMHDNDKYKCNQILV